MFYEHIKGLVVTNDPAHYLKKVKQECEQGKAAAGKADLTFG